MQPVFRARVCCLYGPHRNPENSDREQGIFPCCVVEATPGQKAIMYLETAYQIIGIVPRAIPGRGNLFFDANFFTAGGASSITIPYRNKPDGLESFVSAEICAAPNSTNLKFLKGPVAAALRAVCSSAARIAQAKAIRCRHLGWAGRARSTGSGPSRAVVVQISPRPELLRFLEINNKTKQFRRMRIVVCTGAEDIVALCHVRNSQASLFGEKGRPRCNLVPAGGSWPGWITLVLLGKRSQESPET